MVVRDGTSCLHGLITSCILNVLIGGNDLALIHALVLQGEVDVDGSARLIDLSHSERDPNAVLVKALV